MPRTAVTLGSVAAPIAAMFALAVPGIGSATPPDCGDGQWWDPLTKVCRSAGEGPQILNCGEGRWFDPISSSCLANGELPLIKNCENGWWFDPTTNDCSAPIQVPGQ